MTAVMLQLPIYVLILPPRCICEAGTDPAGSWCRGTFDFALPIMACSDALCKLMWLLIMHIPAV